MALNNNELIVRTEAGFLLLNTVTLDQKIIGYQSIKGLVFNMNPFMPLSKDKSGNIYIAVNVEDSIKIWRYNSCKRRNQTHLVAARTFAQSRRCELD